MVDCFEPRYVQSRVVLLKALDESAFLFSLRVEGFSRVITCSLTYVIVHLRITRMMQGTSSSVFQKFYLHLWFPTRKQELQSIA